MQKYTCVQSVSYDTSSDNIIEPWMLCIYISNYKPFIQESRKWTTAGCWKQTEIKSVKPQTPLLHIGIPGGFDSSVRC